MQQGEEAGITNILAKEPFKLPLTKRTTGRYAAVAQKQFSARIYGRVQGVGFRFFAREVANELGVVGYIRNTADGGVEVLAEGDEGSLERFLDLLKEGPRAANVTRVDLSWSPPTGAYDRFYVKA